MAEQRVYRSERKWDKYLHVLEDADRVRDWADRRATSTRTLLSLATHDLPPLITASCPLASIARMCTSIDRPDADLGNSCLYLATDAGSLSPPEGTSR